MVAGAQGMTMGDSRQHLGKPNTHQNERDPEVMRIQDCMIKR